MSHDAGHPPLLGGGSPLPPELGPRAHWTMDSERDDPPGMWDKKENVARLFNVLYAVCAVLVALDLYVGRHAEHPWEQVKEFYPLYGFVGIVLLVVVAKGLRRLVMRPEDYYGPE